MKNISIKKVTSKTKNKRTSLLNWKIRKLAISNILLLTLLVILININLILPQIIQNNYPYGKNSFGQSAFNTDPYYRGYSNTQYPYSRYAQQPNYYESQTNRDPYGRNSFQTNSYNRNDPNSRYYFDSYQNRQPTFTSGGSYSPSRNIQYFPPQNQRFSTGGYNSYNNLGQNTLTSGSGAFGLSGLYGYGQYNGQFGFNPEMCQNRQDFLVHIAPGGCTPAVIRSDLLEEQNVPVFCKLQSFQINPLLSGTRIRSIRVKGSYPKGISGISYIPSRSALFQNRFGLGFGSNYLRGSNSRGLSTSGSSYGAYSTGFFSSGVNGRDFVSSPVNDDLGHLVVVASQQFNESSMPDFIEGNITAVIDYDSSGIFGVGKTNFYLGEQNEDEWQRDYRQNGFWNGKAYVRAEAVESDRATISIYRDQNTKENTVSLLRGQTSQDIYLGGFYCSAGMRIRLDEIGPPVESVLLQINDQQLWVSKGDRIINERCIVSNIISQGNGGKLTLSCPRNRFDLSLNSGKANFIVDNVQTSIGIKERIKGNIFLGYLGRDSNGDDIAVLVDHDEPTTSLEFVDKDIFSVVEKMQDHTDPNKIEQEIKNKYNKEDKISVIVLNRQTNAQQGIKLSDVFVAKDRFPDDANYPDPLAMEYYNNAINNYQNLFDLYSHEKRAEGQEPLAAQGLLQAAKLSLSFGMNEQASRFFNDLITNYPDSPSAQQATYERNLLFKYDRTNSKKVVEVDRIQYSIDILEFKKPTTKEASAVFLINGKEKTLGLKELYNIDNTNIQLINLDIDRATIGYEYNDKEGRKVSRSETLILGEKSQTKVSEVNVRLNHINLEKQARITITPNAYGTRTEANFLVKVGIEKRAIQLSPEKTKEVMENLLKSIESWNSINEKLGKVISALKGACFATSAVLTVKNLFEGYSGESLARNRLMTTAGGWNDKCEELVSQKAYTSLQQCLLDKSDEVENDVELYAQEIQKTNEIMKNIQDEVGITHSDVLDFQGQTDASDVSERFKEGAFKEFCDNAQGSIKLPGAGGKQVAYSEICIWDTMTHEQRRDIMTLSNIRNSGSEVLRGYADRELGRMTLDAQNFFDRTELNEQTLSNTNKYDLNLKTTNPVGDSVTYGNIKIISNTDSDHSIYGRYKAGEDRVIRVLIPHKLPNQQSEPVDPSVAGKEVIIQIKETDPGIFIPDTSGKIFTIGDNPLEITEEQYNDARRSVFEYLTLSKMNRIKQGNLKAFQNQMVNPDKLRVKYFERAPYRGLPSEIPFDVEEGWYVKMTYVLAGFGQPYDQSGRITNYYICNVGPNGLIEFKKSSDDICRYYNGHSPDLSFPGMSSSESALLVQKAQQAINEASRQYGQERVTVNGRGFQSGVSFDSGEGQCTDFMSATDCNIMFNVCDPVICPSSRCDLGGRYRVDNVIQTGIVGSLALCLPNINEGIAIPICLTGVHAGLDNYISILNSTAACLNESLETGRNIGICDEIKSVYLCDFFWRQATPFLDVLLERTFEVIAGQGVRGGGEYLTVRNAWENTRSAVDYFTQQYAVNSAQAFHSRSLNDANTVGSFGGTIGNTGAEFCKAFISSGFSGATSSVFESLIEPDSPEQYSGWFSENVISTATFPPISHYKVYFHIFAGKDIGAFYSVYLKDSPTIPGIHSTGIFVVDRGYIARGSQVDQAKDLTAVSGFKQLCININGREECGFGQVSTSYLLNSITDTYAQEQAQTNIISEKQCIAGTPSFYSLAQPNIQAGVEDLIQPQLYNQGIVRICSTENPGNQVLPSGEYDATQSTYDRWREVGYCDDPTIKCWIDTNSVKDVIRDTGIEEQVLEDINLNALGQNDYYLPDQSESILSETDRFIDNLVINKGESKTSIETKINSMVTQLELLSNLGANNIFRARALLSLATIHKKIALSLLGNEDQLQQSDQVIEKYDQILDSSVYISPTDTEQTTPVEQEVNADDFYLENNLENDRIFNSKGGDTNYFIEERIRVIKQDTRIPYIWTTNTHVADIVNNQIVVTEDEYKVDEMKELDGLFVDFKTNRIYKDDSIPTPQQIQQPKDSNEILQEAKFILENLESLPYSYKFKYATGWISNDQPFRKSNYDYETGIQEIVKKLTSGGQLRVSGIGQQQFTITRSAEDTNQNIISNIQDYLTGNKF